MQQDRMFNSIVNGRLIEVTKLQPKSVLCLEGGGTIASVPTSNGKTPRLTLKEIFERTLPDYSTLADVIFSERGPVLGELIASPNIEPSHYLKFAEAIFFALKKSSAESILLSLGTDTLAFVAAALSEIFPVLNKAVVLTGAQRSIEEKNTDIPFNLQTALLAIRFLPPGIYVAFGGVIIEGAVVSKMSSKRDDGFVAVNAEPVAIFKSETAIVRTVTIREHDAQLPDTIDCRFDQNIRIETLFPGYNPGDLDAVFRIQQKHGVILRAYGLGNVPTKGAGSILPVLQEWAKQRPIVDSTLCVDGGTDISIYEAGRAARDAGVLEAGTLSFELATVRLMRLLATKNSLEEIRDSWDSLRKYAANQTYRIQ